MALVAVTSDHIGPWQRAKGHERGILIEGLGVGELVKMHCEFKSLLEMTYGYSADGQFPFPSDIVRFRFEKIASGRHPTFVKVVLEDA